MIGWEWTHDEIQQFYTALDELDTAMTKAGERSEELVARYFEQKRSGMVEPAKVLNRIAVATQRWLNQEK